MLRAGLGQLRKLVQAFYRHFAGGDWIGDKHAQYATQHVIEHGVFSALVVLSGSMKLFYALKMMISSKSEVGMAIEQTRPDDDDEPTEAEIEEQKRRQEQTWKHDDSRELSDRDQERPLKP